jgi:hypothetical protein
MRCFLCLVLLAMFALVECQAAAPGVAVFVRLTGAADDARADVYAQSLAGGDARVLVAHTALPKSFRGRIARALPSPDGAVLLLVESDGFVILNRQTGATRLVLGSAYTMGEDETVAEQFGGGCWLWSRNTGTVKRIALSDPNESADPLGWSPRGKLLLVRVTNAHTGCETLRVFNAATGKARSVRTVHELIFALWTRDGAAVLVGERLSEQTSRLALVSLTGTTQLLFTCPVRVFTAAISPEGRDVAIGDTSGFYLLNWSGRARRKLALSAPEGTPGGNMAFSADGSKLAILSSSAVGELYLNIREELWVIQTKTAQARRVAQWDVTLGNLPGEDATHVLLGWAPDRSALFLVSQSCTLQGEKTDWRKLWLQPTGSAQPGRVVADTGPYGIDMSWWGRLPKGKDVSVPDAR